MPKMRLLVDDWRESWRFLSVRAAALVIAWGMLPEKYQIAIVDLLHLTPSHASAVLGLLVIAGRLIYQKGKGSDATGQQ